MNEITFVMEVLQAKKDLLCDDFDKRPRNSLLLVPLYQGKQILPQRFEDDADMSGLWPLM